MAPAPEGASPRPGCVYGALPWWASNQRALGGPESWRQAHGPPEPLPSLDRQTPSLRLTYVPSCPLHRGHAHKGFWECAGITNKATAAA